MPPNTTHRGIMMYVVVSLVAIGVLLVMGLGYLRYAFYAPFDYGPQWMDAPNTADSARLDASYRQSSHASPTLAQQRQPVVVLVHGFSSSSRELAHIKTTIQSQAPHIQWSSVVMGGHGQDYHAFKTATRHDWAAPVKAEINALITQGYTSIYLLGVSAGASILLDLIVSNDIPHTSIRRLIMVDPYIIPKSRAIYVAPYFKWIVPNTQSTPRPALSDTTDWYVNRPVQAICELLDLVKHVQGHLKAAPVMPLPMTIVASDGDPVADSRSVDWLLRVFPHAQGVMVSSNHHVIINPTNKSHWSDRDEAELATAIRVIQEAISPSRDAPGIDD